MLYLVYSILVILLGGRGRFVFSKATAYDQRQTGDVNVQIHLKDVQVVALLNTDLLDEYTDYDYAYDYADFTLKPILKPTTTSTPSVPTTSVKPWTTWPTNGPSSTSTSADHVAEITISNATKTQMNASLANHQSEESTTVSTAQRESTAEGATDVSPKEQNQTSDNRLILDEKQTPANVDEKTKNATTATTTAASLSVDSLKNLKTCPLPYVTDKKGRCRNLKNRRRISLVPLTMKLNSRLTGKDYLPVRKDLPIRIYESDSYQ